MMLCDRCHTCDEPCTFQSPSRGPCEDCGEVANCTDCHEVVDADEEM